MLNHFNFEEKNGQILITNDLGKYAILDHDIFEKFISGSLEPETVEYKELKEKNFIIEKYTDILAENVQQSIREMKNYLFSATSLHIFALTNACNLNCIYCQARNQESDCKEFMSPEVAKKAVKIALHSPERNLTFEFQGGEPLLNFEAIKAIVDYTEANKGDKQINYTMTSNLVALNEEKLQYFKRHKIGVSTSLDGPRHLQEKNRLFLGHGSSYDAVIRGLKKLREYGLSTGAIETTTRFSLEYGKEIVDEYIQNDLHGMFIRPLTPLGFAKDDWSKIGYSAEEFLNFYRETFEYILKLNKEGTFFSELTATYFLSKILNGTAYNFMELRSPCGAGIGQMCYYYDGNVYSCDEGRMVAEAGDPAFKIGTVDNSYDEIVQNPICKALVISSTNEAIPACSDCVYQPYCGVCPIINYALEGDIFTRSVKNYRCKIYKGIQDILFNIIINRTEDKKILESWLQ